MVDDKQYENAMDVFQNIKTYPYEQDRVREYIAKIEAELEKIRQEKEKESLARNYLNQGNQKFNQRSYQEALDNYVLALSILEEIDGRENLKLEAKHFIQKTRKILKELEREKARERIRKIEEGIERGRREYILGNYTKSIFYLQEVLQLDPQNLVAQNYLDLAQEAQRIESIGKIDPRDPFYSIYLSLKSEGLSLQGKADNLYKQGDKEKGKELFQEALNKWQTIKRAFPYNEEARKNIRYILRYIDPEGWKAAIQEDLDKALQLAEAGNKAAAYEIVKEVREEAPGFPRINYYLKKTEPEKKEKKLSENEKREVARRYNQALSLFTRREYREALKLTENIIRENRYVKEEESVEKVKSLYLKIKNMLETERTKTTDLTMDAIIERTKYYRQALSFYQKGEYQNAINLSRKALQIDPSYNSAKNLLSSARKRLNL
jgi:tetratricopeptide (TPR) repeat protein